MFLPPSKCFLVLLPLLAAQAQNLTYPTPQVFPYAEISGSPIQTSNNPITAVAGDFNGDGIKDFVLLAQLAGTSSLQFFAGSVAGQFVGANQIVCSQNDICYKIAAGDLDGDGDLDLAVSTSAGIQIYIDLVLVATKNHVVALHKDTGEML